MDVNRISGPVVLTISMALVIVGIVLMAKPHAELHDIDSMVIKVFDGDTVQIENGEHVRLIGIDCPEYHDSEKLYNQVRRTGEDIAVIKARGQLAYLFTRKWLLGQKVHIQFDSQKRDKYGRLLGYIFVPFPHPALSQLPRDGYIMDLHGVKWYFINGTIMQAGYAVVMTIPPNVKYADIFTALYAQARENKVGLWNPQQELPVNPQKKGKKSKKVYP